MAQNRYYSSVAGVMTLTAPISSLDTVYTIDTTAGLPPLLPFTLVLSPGTNSEEITTVTSLAGTTVTCVRGADGTVPVAHVAGSQVLHMDTARDFDEPQKHMAATQGVHGLGGSSSVVGTTDTQTLTGKSMSGSSNTFTNIPLGALPADVATTDTTQTFTNKTLTAPTITNPTVTGSSHITGGLTVDSLVDSGTAAITGAATVGGTLGVTGATTLAALTTTGITNSGNNAVTGNVTAGGTLGVTGAATVGSLTTAGSISVAGSAAVTGNVGAGTFSAVSMAPKLAFQVSDAGARAAAAYTDLGTDFPAFTFVPPPSGRVRIDLTATLSNTNTTTSNIAFTFRVGTSVSGITAPGSGSTQTIYQDVNGVLYSGSGAGRTALTQASWGPIVTVGPARQTVSLVAQFTAGETVTITPQYRISTGSAGTSATSGGTITVTPLV